MIDNQSSMNKVYLERLPNNKNELDKFEIQMVLIFFLCFNKTKPYIPKAIKIIVIVLILVWSKQE